MRSFKLQAIFCACTGRFLLELFGNHIIGFPTSQPMCLFSVLFQKLDSSSETSSCVAGDLERAHSDGDLADINKGLLEARRESK